MRKILEWMMEPVGSAYSEGGVVDEGGGLDGPPDVVQVADEVEDHGSTDHGQIEPHIIDIGQIVTIGRPSRKPQIYQYQRKT